MGKRQLAQINVTRLQYPRDHPQLNEFFANLDAINALADASEGFVWRMVDEEGANATGISVSADPQLIVNVSVWRDLEALKGFVYRTEHAKIMAKRRDWMVKSDQPSLALWWIDREAYPRAETAMARLEFLRRHGPSEKSFTFQTAGDFSG